MKVLIYSSKDFEIPYIKKANNNVHQIEFTQERLTKNSVQLAVGFKAISIFSADDASAEILEKLKDFGVKYISLRTKGFDNVNLMKARALGIKVANVPDYSAYSVAEHAIALLLGLNRKLLVSHQQMKMNNFSLSNLVGFDVAGKKSGIIGTGKIGKIIGTILKGFGAEVSAFDINPDDSWAISKDITYSTLTSIYMKCDLIFLAVPLNTTTHHMIDASTISKMKKGVIIINIARGSVVNTLDILKALDNDQLGGYDTDVYEKESSVFFYDLSKDDNLKDEVLKELIYNPKVLLTPHQAFATKEALKEIAETTLDNINSWNNGFCAINELIHNKGLVKDGL